MAGRPLKFQTPEELKAHCAFDESFKTEKEFCDYLQANMELFLSDRGEASPLECAREKYFAWKRFGANTPRIDFVVKLPQKTIGIEVKNPTNIKQELTNAIGQILYYKEIDRYEQIDEFWLVTSKLDLILLAIIKRYSLPIRVFVVTREFNCEIKP